MKFDAILWGNDHTKRHGTLLKALEVLAYPKEQ